MLGVCLYPSGPAVTKKRGAGKPLLQSPLLAVCSTYPSCCSTFTANPVGNNEVAFQLNWPLFTRYFHDSYVFHYANGNGFPSVPLAAMCPFSYRSVRYTWLFICRLFPTSSLLTRFPSSFPLFMSYLPFVAFLHIAGIHYKGWLKVR